MCIIKIYVVMPSPPLDLHLANKTDEWEEGPICIKTGPPKKRGGKKSRGAKMRQKEG